MAAILDLIDLKAILLIALVFVPLERLLPMRRRQAVLRRGWRTDLFYCLFNRIPIGLGIVVAVGLISAAAGWLAPEALRARVAAQPLWLQTIEIVLLADLGFYAMHRLFHASPRLWRFHAVHHSIEEMDWLAGHRVHPVDQILTKSASLVPCFALGFSGAAIAVFALLYHWHSILLHANVRLGFGPLRWLIASPRFHHWHHGNQPEAWDRNFAGQLSLWDFLFGTAYLPQGANPRRYGVDDPVPAGYGAQFLYPFRPTTPPAAVWEEEPESQLRVR